MLVPASRIIFPAEMGTILWEHVTKPLVKIELVRLASNVSCWYFHSHDNLFIIYWAALLWEYWLLAIFPKACWSGRLLFLYFFLPNLSCSKRILLLHLSWGGRKSSTLYTSVQFLIIRVPYESLWRSHKVCLCLQIKRDSCTLARLVEFKPSPIQTLLV